MAALRAYRHSRGLCYQCAEKWTRDHKCNKQVQLHVVQELWDLFTCEALDSAQSDGGDLSEGTLLHLSCDAVAGTESPKTLKLLGVIQGKEILMLLDSGSSHTFLRASVAQHLQGVSALLHPLRVQIANGGVMRCTHELQNASWTVQGVEFTTPLKILPLHAYGAIIGMDWLEYFSPMKVHWGFKQISIPYAGSWITLQGILAAQLDCTSLQVFALEVSDSQ